MDRFPETDHHHLVNWSKNCIAFSTSLSKPVLHEFFQSVHLLSTDPCTFGIGDTSEFGEYIDGGIVMEAKLPVQLDFVCIYVLVVKALVTNCHSGNCIV